MPKTQAKELPVRVSPLRSIDRDAIVDYKNIRLQERTNLSAIQILAYANKHADTAAAISKALGIECPLTPGICNSNEHTQVAWSTPNSWMVIAGDDASGRSPSELLEKLQSAVGDLAAVVDQSHGRCGLRLSGSRAREVMAKNTAIDLHQLAFQSGQCASTSVAHMSAMVIQVDDTPTYDLFVARSLARSFAHAIEQACQEFQDE